MMMIPSSLSSKVTIKGILLLKSEISNSIRLRHGSLNRGCVGRRGMSSNKGCEVSKQIRELLRCRREMRLETCFLDEDALDPRLEPPSVLVVGAGLAGLSAANRLAAAGLKDITILEAQDRPGGRVHSCWLDEAIVELGAQWIEGASSVNPVYNLASREGLLRDPLLKHDLKRALYMTSTGTAVPLLVNSTVPYTFSLIDDQAADLYSSPKEANEKDGSNLEDFFEARIPLELQVFPNKYRHSASLALFGMLNELRTKVGDDLTKVSANQYGSNYGPHGGSVKVSSGMVGLLAPLLRDLPKCSIIYCKPVKTVSLDKEGVKVVCCDGDAFKKDYCIVTIPLGVLKEGHEKMFTPGLPKEKVEAIKKLGYGHINTLYFAYRRPFWVWREGTFRLARTMDELKDRKEWTMSTGAIEELPDACQVLMCNVAGKDEAKQVEDRSEAALAHDFTKLIRQFLCDPTLPYPSNVIRSKWSSNQFFKGAKSYLAVGSTVKDQCALATPIPEEVGNNVPRLLFAGEATCPGHHATLQGARVSGIREADRIIRLTKKLQGKPQAEEPCTPLTPVN